MTARIFFPSHPNFSLFERMGGGFNCLSSLTTKDLARLSTRAAT